MGYGRCRWFIIIFSFKVATTEWARIIRYFCSGKIRSVQIYVFYVSNGILFRRKNSTYINFTIFLSKFLVFSLFRSIENFLIIYANRIQSTWNSASIDLIFIGVLRLDFEQWDSENEISSYSLITFDTEFSQT